MPLGRIPKVCPLQSQSGWPSGVTQLHHHEPSAKGQKSDTKVEEGELGGLDMAYWWPCSRQAYRMEDLRVIDNFEEDRLREEDLAKEEENRQKKAVRAARGDRGGAGVVAGWAGGVVR